MKNLCKWTILAFAIGCGEKKPPETIVDENGQVQINPRARFVAGLELLKVNRGEPDYAKAQEHFETALNIDPNLVNAHYNAGYCAEKLSRFGKAAEHYENAFKANPSRDFLFALTNAYIKNKQADKAVEAFKSYLEKNPTDNDVRYVFIEALTSNKSYDEAVKEIQAILLINKEDIKAYRLLSRNYYAQGLYDMSLLCAEKANEFAKNDPSILNNIGVTYLNQKLEPDAIKIFKMALEKDPANLEANLNLGFMSLNSGNYKLAQAKFDAALATDKTNLDAQIGLAIALRGNKDYNKSAKLYSTILKSENPSQLVYFNAATFYEMYQKDYSKAQSLLKEYQTKNPESTEVIERLARVQKSQDEEEARIREAKRLAKEKAEREARQQKEFEELKSKAAAVKTRYDALASCEAGKEGLEEVSGYLDGIQEMMAEGDAEAAGEAMPFIEQADEMLNEITTLCESAAPAPEEAAPEGTESKEAAPEEAAPEEAAPEEAAPEEAAPEKESPEKKTE